MRWFLLIRRLMLLVFLLSCGLAAHATHVLGGEITYAPVAATSSVPRYHITIKVYADTSPGTAAQGNIQLTGSYNGCDASAANGINQTLNYTQSSVGTSLGCPSSPVYNYKVYLYETDLDLARGQWVLQVGESNRKVGILNIPNSYTWDIAISAFLDNSLVPQNTSPRFLTTLLPYLCGTQAHSYSFSTFEPEGDSLVYSFVYPQANANLLHQCHSTITGSTLSPHFQMNAATGALAAQAGFVQQGYYVMVARVSEYRRVRGSWQLIGYVMRDVTYLAFMSANRNPQFTGAQVNGSATTQPLSQLIRVQPGQTTSLLLTAADSDAGQTIIFASQSPTIIPGMSLQTVTATQAQLTWQVPATLPPGRYTATVAVLDSGCPPASEEQTISFLVQPQALASRVAATLAPAYPMPFREQVQFMAPAGQAVTIVDALGRVVAQLTSPPDGQVRWQPAATLPAGLYLARSAEGRLLARLLRGAE